MEVTAFADGATNCWSVIWSLERHCKQITAILDWFHIGKKFQNVRSAVEDGDQETLERVKWTLWHGRPDEALVKLHILMTNGSEIKPISCITKNGIKRRRPIPVKWLNLTLSRSSMPDTIRAEKCNGPERERIKCYKSEG